jgi:predicted DNA-binding ribbon-helix-helix protein
MNNRVHHNSSLSSVVRVICNLWILARKQTFYGWRVSFASLPAPGKASPLPTPKRSTLTA